DIPKKCRVVLNIYNIRGQLVKNLVDDVKQPDYYRIQWNGRNAAGLYVSSGFYIYQIQAGKFIKRRKMIVVK
ncbi:MAG: FlgD immunoglobulin-like domain containing protein, partial [bacterium]